MSRKTFGIALHVYDDSAYVQINGITDIPEPPTKKSDEPIDVTTHDSSGGVREFIAPGTFTYNPFTVEMNDIPDDAGQVILAGGIGAEKKFKITKTGDTNIIYCNAIIVSFAEGANPLTGKGTRTLSLHPTGVPPVS